MTTSVALKDAAAEGCTVTWDKASRLGPAVTVCLAFSRIPVGVWLSGCAWGCWARVLARAWKSFSAAWLNRSVALLVGAPEVPVGSDRPASAGRRAHPLGGVGCPFLDWKMGGLTGVMPLALCH